MAIKPDPPSETPIVAEVVEPQRGPPSPGESRGTVLVLLFAALGPLALGVLWKSPRFSVLSKLLLTVLTLGQLVLAVWLLWLVMSWMVGRVA